MKSVYTSFKAIDQDLRVLTLKRQIAKENLLWYWNQSRMCLVPAAKNLPVVIENRVKILALTAVVRKFYKWFRSARSRD